MQLVLVLLHIVICLALIVIVLLQTGKGSEIGAVFGGSSQTLFGSTGGSTFFGKLTTAIAIVFLLTSLILASRSSRYTKESVMTGVKQEVTIPVATENQPTEPAARTQTETAVPETKTPAPAEAEKGAE